MLIGSHPRAAFGASPVVLERHEYGWSNAGESAAAAVGPDAATDVPAAGPAPPAAPVTAARAGVPAVAIAHTAATATAAVVNLDAITVLTRTRSPASLSCVD